MIDILPPPQQRSLLVGERRNNPNGSLTRPYGPSLVGKVVETAYGRGYVVECRRVEEEDGNEEHAYVYTIQLVTQVGERPLAKLHTRDVPVRRKTPQEEAEELYIAYEAQERMRRMNLEMLFFERGILTNTTTTNTIDPQYHERCTLCMLEGKFCHPDVGVMTDRNRFPRLQKFVDSARGTAESAKSSLVPTTTPNESTSNNSATSTSGFPRLRMFVDKTRSAVVPPTTTESNGHTGTTGPSSNNSILPAAFSRLQLSTSPWRVAGASSSVTQTSPETPVVETPTTTIETPTTTADNNAVSETQEATPSEVDACQPAVVVIDSPSIEQEEEIQTNARGTITEPTTPTPERLPSSKTQRTVLPRIQKLLNDREKSSTTPCLICGNPTCTNHRSANFKKEGITVCLSCERLFELDFIMQCVSTDDPAERAERIHHMVDCYDRCLLVLTYSAQYVEQIATSLEEQKVQHNKIGIGSSSAGVLSGALGIAAAASMLTPAGPPLLIASLFFGGGATVVQTGADAYNYFSEPQKLADRIIALHGMLLSLLRVTSTLRDAMMRSHIRTDVFEAEAGSLAISVQAKFERSKAGVLVASNVGRAATLGRITTTTAATEASAVAVAGSSVTAAETAAGAGARGVGALSRAGNAAARTVRFARFAGGALSAAVLVLEANAIQSTLKDISNGSPCDKANRIRAIAEEIKNKALPTTAELDEECQAYLQVLATCPAPLPEVSAVVHSGSSGDLAEFPEAVCEVLPSQQPEQAHLSPPAATTVGASVAALATPMAVVSESQNNQSYFGAGSPLFRRISFGQGGNPPATAAAEYQVLPLPSATASAEGTVSVDGGTTIAAPLTTSNGPVSQTPSSRATTATVASSFLSGARSTLFQTITFGQGGRNPSQQTPTPTTNVSSPPPRTPSRFHNTRADSYGMFGTEAVRDNGRTRQREQDQFNLLL